MKKFLFRTFNYLAILLAVATILQLIISARIKDKVLYGSDNLYAVKGQKNDIVFLGSSRCFNQFDPWFFRDSAGASSVNLGIQGHADITVYLIRLKYYLANNPPPKAVILSFDPYINAGPYNVQKDFTHKDHFSRYAFFPRNEDKMIVDYFGFNFFEKYIPLYALLKYQVFIKCISPYKKTIWETRGVAINPNVWDTTVAPYGDALQSALRSYNAFKIYYDSIKGDLQSLNNLCKENNIKLLCVQMPLFRGLYRKDGFDLVTKMCDECGVPVINTNDEFNIGDPRNFADPYHLNYQGVPQAMNIIVKNQKFIDALKR